MTTKLPEVDVVVVGVGWTGSILARELTKAGLKVVGLERGPRRMPGEDFTVPSIRDDLKYAVRQELFQDTQMETMSLRHASTETALPIRRLGAFLPGTGLGGAGAHWNGVTWRLLPTDHNLRTHLRERYGAQAIPEEMTITDYPISYDEPSPTTTGSRNCAASPGKRAICAARSSMAATYLKDRVNPNTQIRLWSRASPAQRSKLRPRASAIIRFRRRRATRAASTRIPKA